MTAKKITIEGFLDEFKNRHDQMEDRPFCWILGSGASVQSGIPTGGALVKQWLSELHRQEDFTKGLIDAWATADNLGIPDFEYERAANFYPWVYQRRFHDYKEQGYAFLEKVMERAEPSFGYSVLAQIMATTQHKVAITTNFDNLVADALAIYTRTFPLVCGHESLTGYIRSNLRRPLVAKIHRDLLLAPLNSPEEIAKLPGEWASALKRILDRFTPIVIGYGGNDGSLMGFLARTPPIEGSIFWCYREGDEIDAVIHDVVELHRGRLVPIAGFDEVMLQFQEKLQLPFLLPQLQNMHDNRVAAYQKQFEMLATALRKPAQTETAEKARTPARKAAEAAVERLTKEKDWWAWQLKADAEPDVSNRETLYRAGLEEFPNSAELTGNFANFMKSERKNYEEAERLYRKALELDPTDADYTGNFANFMTDVREDHNEAERLYRNALEMDPSNVLHTCNFAIFMSNVRRDYDQAERFYRKALEFESGDPYTIGHFANFMQKVRKNYEEAEGLYRKALELDPNNAHNAGNLASFMYYVRKDYDEAERLYRRALELDPTLASNIGNFASFIYHVRKDYPEAERLYREALRLSPNDPTKMGNFAQFKAGVGQLEEAGLLSRQALHLLGETASQTLAEVTLTQWLLDRAATREGGATLGRLKTLLQVGFERGQWTFEQLLATLTPRLSEGDKSLVQKLAAAILDESKVPTLDDEPLWNETAAVSLSIPLPE